MKTKNYMERDVIAGQSIDDCVNDLIILRKSGVLAKCNFNGIFLYSDSVTLDSAYLDITGKTKNEYNSLIREQREEYKRREKEHLEKIPELTIEWIEKGKNILSEDKWNEWETIVPFRLSDLYEGKELESCLKIIKKLNDNDSFDEVKDEIESQGHSGMSFGLVCSMVAHFHNDGSDFVEYMNKLKGE